MTTHLPVFRWNYIYDGDEETKLENSNSYLTDPSPQQPPPSPSPQAPSQPPLPPPPHLWMSHFGYVGGGDCFTLEAGCFYSSKNGSKTILFDINKYNAQNWTFVRKIQIARAFKDKAGFFSVGKFGKGLMMFEFREEFDDDDDDYDDDALECLHSSNFCNTLIDVIKSNKAIYCVNPTHYCERASNINKRNEGISQCQGRFCPVFSGTTSTSTILDDMIISRKTRRRKAGGHRETSGGGDDSGGGGGSGGRFVVGSSLFLHRDPVRIRNGVTTSPHHPQNTIPISIDELLLLLLLQLLQQLLLVLLLRLPQWRNVSSSTYTSSYAILLLSFLQLFSLRISGEELDPVHFHSLLYYYNNNDDESTNLNDDDVMYILHGIPFAIRTSLPIGLDHVMTCRVHIIIVVFSQIFNLLKNLDKHVVLICFSITRSDDLNHHHLITFYRLTMRILNTISFENEVIILLSCKLIDIVPCEKELVCYSDSLIVLADGSGDRDYTYDDVLKCQIVSDRVDIMRYTDIVLKHRHIIEMSYTLKNVSSNEFVLVNSGKFGNNVYCGNECIHFGHRGKIHTCRSVLEGGVVSNKVEMVCCTDHVFKGRHSSVRYTDTHEDVFFFVEERFGDYGHIVNVVTGEMSTKTPCCDVPGRMSCEIKGEWRLYTSPCGYDVRVLGGYGVDSRWVVWVTGQWNLCCCCCCCCCCGGGGGCGCYHIGWLGFQWWWWCSSRWGVRGSSVWSKSCVCDRCGRDDNTDDDGDDVEDDDDADKVTEEESDDGDGGDEEVNDQDDDDDENSHQPTRRNNGGATRKEKDARNHKKEEHEIGMEGRKDSSEEEGNERKGRVPNGGRGVPVEEEKEKEEKGEEEEEGGGGRGKETLAMQFNDSAFDQTQYQNENAKNQNAKYQNFQDSLQLVIFFHQFLIWCQAIVCQNDAIICLMTSSMMFSLRHHNLNITSPLFNGRNMLNVWNYNVVTLQKVCTQLLLQLFCFHCNHNASSYHQYPFCCCVILYRDVLPNTTNQCAVNLYNRKDSRVCLGGFLNILLNDSQIICDNPSLLCHHHHHNRLGHHHHHHHHHHHGHPSSPSSNIPTESVNRVLLSDNLHRHQIPSLSELEIKEENGNLASTSSSPHETCFRQARDSYFHSLIASLLLTQTSSSSSSSSTSFSNNLQYSSDDDDDHHHHRHNHLHPNDNKAEVGQPPSHSSNPAIKPSLALFRDPTEIAEKIKTSDTFSGNSSHDQECLHEQENTYLKIYFWIGAILIYVLYQILLFSLETSSSFLRLMIHYIISILSLCDQNCPRKLKSKPSWCVPRNTIAITISNHCLNKIHPPHHRLTKTSHNQNRQQPGNPQRSNNGLASSNNKNTNNNTDHNIASSSSCDIKNDAAPTCNPLHLPHPPHHHHQQQQHHQHAFQQPPPPTNSPTSGKLTTQSRQRRKWRSVSRFSYPVILAIVLIFHGLPRAAAQGISGSITTCSNENKPVTIAGITDDPCIDCFCQQGVVQCKKQRCQKLEGCHAILFDQPTEMCCDVCKGCRYKGVSYESGEQWRDEKKPCLVRTCRAGVVTKSKMKCFTHCYDAKPVEGQCCPVCSGCRVRGRQYKEGDIFTLPTDRCTECVCKNNSVQCERTQCPVLNCPAEVIYQPKDQCCPMCRGMRRVFEVRSRCYFAKRIYKRHQRFRPDKCSSCICRRGSSVCVSESCPPLDCPTEEQVPVSGSACCRKCVEKKNCVFEGKTYKHREEWRPNVCMGCSCDEGVTYCQRERCSNSLWCPQGYRLLLSPDECCPKCVEHDAVCSVFGDPHYRTFDGLMYSFQGTCKYVLAKDCSPKREFYIKVRNSVRFSTGYAWTQMLVVYVHGHRISMLQGSVVKVNSRKVKPPFSRDSFSIVMDGDLVKLKTTLGLQVTWDGDSFLEVKVNTRFKDKMCGLCGNYNGIKSDDLIGHDGTIYSKGGEYGHSWRVGSERACAVTPTFVEKEPLCEHDDRAKRQAHRVCNVFFSRVFSKCRAKLKVDNYVSSCITDMCDCPEGRDCACEAIKAYASLCERSGIPIDRSKIRICRAPNTRCPRDSVLVKCKDSCPRSCHSGDGGAYPGFKPEPCPERCLDGCMCKDDLKVMHAGKCIPKSLCPTKS